jgi:hypothetical protein
MNWEPAELEDINGTSLQGYVVATYEELTDAFGASVGASDKVEFEWQVKFSDGTVATVYDWKRYETEPPVGLFTWNVGGRSSESVTLVEEALKEMLIRGKEVL